MRRMMKLIANEEEQARFSAPTTIARRLARAISLARRRRAKLTRAKRQTKRAARTGQFELEFVQLAAIDSTHTNRARRSRRMYKRNRTNQREPLC